MRLSSALLILLPGFTAFSQPSEGDLNYYLLGSKNSADVIRANKIRKELIYKCYFDRHNRADTVLTDSIIYNSHGQVFQSTEFIHLSRMRVIKTFEYDSLGRVYKIREDHFFPRTHSFTDLFLNDSAGREKALYYLFKDGRYQSARRNEYDKDGKLMGVYVGNFLQTQFFYSDNTGRLEKVVDYWGKNVKAVTYKYTYSINERERKIVEIGRGESRLYEESFFDEQGRIARTISRQMVIFEEDGYRRFIPDKYTTVFATFSYNPDGTLFEWTEYRGKRSQTVFCHYYETD